MKFINSLRIALPDEFPGKEFDHFMEIGKSFLLIEKNDSWKQFGGASNSICFRYRSCHESMEDYIDSWNECGEGIEFEGWYLRERALFVMIVSGCSCIESTLYAIYALASHKSTFGVPFGKKEQKYCYLNKLKSALKGKNYAVDIVEEMESILASNKWETWTDLRNRMIHRTTLPRIIRATNDFSENPKEPAKYAETSSSPEFRADDIGLVQLFDWLSESLSLLLTKGSELAESAK